MRKRFFIIAAAVTILAGICVYAAATDGLFGNINNDVVLISKDEYESLKKYEKLDQIYYYIENFYYQEPDRDAMMEGAIYGMLSALDDPYTFYYNEENWSRLWDDDTGDYAGVGIQMLINYRDNSVTISRVFKDSPAETAGIKKGDVLKRVDDLDVTAQSSQEAVNVMRGKEAETVEIEIERKGEPIIFTVPRALIHSNRIEYKMLENQVGYIYLYEFAGDCALRFTQALEELEAAGAKSLIVDMRDNGGGWVGDAITIEDLFVDEEMVFYTEDRAGERTLNYTEDGKTDVPLVMLVNEGSASSSEILSGSLQDLGRARVVGTKTYGKGVIQSVVTLPDQTDGLQFTSEQYFLPSEKAVHHVGIMPDIIVNMPEDLIGNYFEFGDMSDPQLKTAWETAFAMQDGSPEPTSEPIAEEKEAVLAP